MDLRHKNLTSGSCSPCKPLMSSHACPAQDTSSTGVPDFMAVLRHQGALEMPELLLSSKNRRYHSDPGFCMVKTQRHSSTPLNWLAAGIPHGSCSHCPPTLNSHPCLLASTTSCTSDDAQQQPASSSGDSSSKQSAEGASSNGRPVFTIIADSCSTAPVTNLWQRVQQLERRNKELEQQVEQLQASSEVTTSYGQQSSQQPLAQQQQQQHPWMPSKQQSHTEQHASAMQQPLAGAKKGNASVIYLVADCHSSTAEQSAATGQQTQVQDATSTPVLQQLPRQQGGLQQQSQKAAPHSHHHQQKHQDQQPQQSLEQQHQQLPAPGEGAEPVAGVAELQREINRLQQLNYMLQSDNADLEMVLKETERQRREFAARYAFMTLDTDGDGYVSVEQVQSYDLFSCYAPSVLRAAFSVWRWDSGFPGFLCMDDFVRFVEYAEDRSTRDSQRFWFLVMDADGDGRLSWADMKLLYDAVNSSVLGGVFIQFEDLSNQIRDMVEQQDDPRAGFTAQELWDSKLGAGVIGLLTNANNMLLQRSTAEWGRGDFPL